MNISFDAAKRAATLKTRRLDFADALELFDGRNVTIRDDRRDYGEIALSRLAFFMADAW